jgi:hypothetical protein
MGNTESSSLQLTRPGPLMEEALRNNTMGFHEAAMAKYKRAYELYKEAGSYACAAKALRLAAETGLETPEPDFELASKAFEQVGALYMKSDITKVAAISNYANAVYCFLVVGKGSTAKTKYDEYKQLCGLDDSLEWVGVKSILESFQNGNKNSTQDRVEGFKDVSNAPLWRQKLLDRVVERLS